VGQKLVIRRKVKEDKESNKDNIAATKDKPVQSASVQKFHVAKAGETYADVADQYNLLLSDVENWNVFEEPFAGGEVIKIVAPEANTAQTRDNIDEKKGNSKIDDEKIHTVASGETLYSISSQYDIAIEDLRKWNNLYNYQLSLGQKLYIKNPDAFVVDEEVENEVDKEKEETPTVDVVNMASDKQKQDTKAYFTVEEEDIPKIEKVVEKGVAEVIEGSDNTEKYLALHRTAKIGTIMQVRNDLNDQIVFVRVLGKLPDTGVDEKVIIRISKKAFQRLGGVDYKFPVEISYLPLND
jgi:LysM repeat protein